MGYEKKHASIRGWFSRILAWLCFLYVGICLSESRVQAGLIYHLTAENLTVGPGQSGTMNVIWSSTQAVNYLNTQFVIKAITGSAGGAVFTEVVAGVPPMPPVTDSNYVFSGNSSAVTAGGNPASVGTDAWASDSYFLLDATGNSLDYLQDGSRLWTTLNITGIDPGTYQLHLINSEYDYNSTGGAAEPLTDANLSGGLITVTTSGGTGAVPEPSSMVIFGLCAAATALRVQRRQQS
jgi:hypothetical protein